MSPVKMKINTLCLIAVVVVCGTFKTTESLTVPFSSGDQNIGNGQIMQSVCKNICVSPMQCPRPCLQFYLDQAPPTYQKRGDYLDGFTFDDYLFMRLLGRDMYGRRR